MKVKVPFGLQGKRTPRIFTKKNKNSKSTAEVRSENDKAQNNSMGACNSTSNAVVSTAPLRSTGASTSTLVSHDRASHDSPAPAKKPGAMGGVFSGCTTGDADSPQPNKVAFTHSTEKNQKKKDGPAGPPSPNSQVSSTSNSTPSQAAEAGIANPYSPVSKNDRVPKNSDHGASNSSNSVGSNSSQSSGGNGGFSSNSSGTGGTNGGGGDKRHAARKHGSKHNIQDLSASGHEIDLSASHRRRKSRQLTHSDSKLGLGEIICGDLPNPNLVRIEVPLGKPIEEVYEGVHDGPVLGSGISGIVRLVKHRTTQVAYAVKCLDLALIDSEEGLKQLKEEIYIMCQLDHPNIVRLEEVYESHSEIYLVQEVCKGGELFDRLDEQPDYHYTEAQCARLVKQMLSSVRYIHNKGIIHRDLKLENFLFSEMEPGSELKMIDFGLSKHFTFGEVHHEAVGTPYTVAPEVIRGSYDERCDVWAIGVITFLLLSGEPPFGGCGGPETLMQVRDNILRGAFEFEPADIWETVSQEAKDFILSLLVVDPMDRPTARQAKESRWLRMWSSRENEGNAADSMINPNVVKALVGFKEYSDMRKLLCEVLSFTLLPEQIQDLRKEFEKYDQEGTGEITLSTLKKVLIGNASTGSLGGLTEEEVVDIFNAMRVRKGETSIHWHDFIAAGLSQCQVDDRNLRLAFERLDQDHKGYITFENVMDLMGDSSFENEDQMLKMWGESMKDVNLRFISYEDFVLLMKGQKRDRNTALRSSLLSLAAVPEILLEEDEDENHDEDDEHVVKETQSPLGSFHEKEFPSLPLDASSPNEISGVRKPKLSPKEVSPPDLVPASPSPGRTKTFVRMGSNSAPATPVHFGKRFDESEQMDSPISLEEGAGSSGAVGSVSFNEHVAFQMPDLGNLTPPQTPVRGPTDYVTPTTMARHTAKMDSQMMSHLAPPDLSMPATSALPSPLANSMAATSMATSLATNMAGRGRSVSLDEKDRLSADEIDSSGESRRSMMFKRDSRRAMAIPEHTHDVSDIDRVIEDRTKTPLVVNRALYRAHREFRHAVTEACRRFEDEQMRRAREALRAREEENEAGNGRNYKAGLVMRHGQALSEDSIKNFLKKTLEEQQRQVDQANRRGGRGRRSRKKTISDMSGMMGGSTGSPGPPEAKAMAHRHTVVEDTSKKESLAPVKENENLLRNPTKPGEFRKTNYDPFQRKSIFENNAGGRNSSSSSAGAMPSAPPAGGRKSSSFTAGAMPSAHPPLPAL